MKTRKGDYNDDGTPAVRVTAAPDSGTETTDVADAPVEGDGGLEGLTVSELRTLAQGQGIDLPARARKDEIIDAIREDAG